MRRFTTLFVGIMLAFNSGYMGVHLSEHDGSTVGYFRDTEPVFDVNLDNFDGQWYYTLVPCEK